MVMQITSVTIYAIQMLKELSQAKDEAMTSLELARRLDISIPYAMKVTTALRRAKLVKAKLGGEGGYRLARPLEWILLSDLLAGVDHGILADKKGETAGMLTVRRAVRKRVLKGLREVSVASIL